MKTKSIRPGLWPVIAVAGLAALPASAFEISGAKWPGAVAEIHVALDGESLSGISWNTAFISAADEWSENTDFDFIVREEYLDPCLGDGRNGVDFTEDVCGSQYGQNTLAVTLRKFSASLLGPPTLSEADIIINQDEDYNVYDGPLVQFGVPGLDFRRVALHELGHAIGLDHEPLLPAVMAPEIGDVDRLLPDDIAGVNTLYGGLAACGVKPLKFGNFGESLSQSDCQVRELTAGGDDNSFIDVYEFTLTATTELEFSMTSPTLDSVLLLADAGLNVFAVDNSAFSNCDSSLSRTLGPGSYFLLANTFNEVVKEDCGNSGDYEIQARFSATELIELGANSSLLGDVSSASFAAGISADGGQTYGNIFAPDASLDIVGESEVDFVHVGQSGFLVVAAVIDGGFLLLDSEGNFQPWQAGAPLIRAREKILEESEAIVIARDLVPEQLGIEEISVDFYIGYGLNENPGELYFHAAPLTLTVSPESP